MATMADGCRLLIQVVLGQIKCSDCNSYSVEKNAHFKVIVTSGFVSSNDISILHP